MPRYGRYLRLEKNIAASDTGGIKERWHYGWCLLTDPKRVTNKGNLKNGVLDELIDTAKSIGVKLSRSEIQYRMQAARTYETEAQLSKILGQFENWWRLIQAGFPQVEADPDDEPYDPHAADRKPPKATPQEPLTTSDGKRVPEFDPPVKFSGDEHGPRSTIEDLYAACKESEGYTERMAVNDAKRRGYVDDLADAAGGDLTKTWYEAELLRRGLEAFGLSGIDSLDEIMDEFFDAYDKGTFRPDPDEDDEDDEDE
jgi:hypothetical protein